MFLSPERLSEQRPEDRTLAPDAKIIDSIRLLVTDVDGVLTDGRIVYDDGGRETKRFHVRDGTAVKLWLALDRPFAVISARRSEIVDRRMGELGVERIVQGADDKGAAIASMMEQAGIAPGQTCYIGDDLADLAAMKRVALPVAVADAVDEVKRAAQWVTQTPGGLGVLREIVERILRHQGKWDEALKRATG